MSLSGNTPASRLREGNVCEANEKKSLVFSNIKSFVFILWPKTGNILQFLKN